MPLQELLMIDDRFAATRGQILRRTSLKSSTCRDGVSKCGSFAFGGTAATKHRPGDPLACAGPDFGVS
eukprot:s1179_g26.t1